MKKAQLTLILAVLLFHTINAQNIKGFISGGGGLSLPMGNITKTAYSDLSSGFSATTGGIYTLDAGYFFHPHFGVGMNLSFGSYKMRNPEAFALAAIEAYEIEEASVIPGRYNYLNVLPAFYYTTGGSKFAFDIRILAGYQNLKTPEITVNLEENSIIQKAGSSGGFAYGAGIAARFPLTSKIGLRLGIDYINSNPDISIKTEGINNPMDGLRIVEKYNEQIGMLNASIGIVYQFGTN